MNTINLLNRSLLLLLSVPFFASAQVGINTTTPNANSALDVNGRIVIQDLSRTGTGISGVKILLLEQDGSVIGATLDANLISEDITNALTISNNNTTTTNDKIVLINEDFGTKNNWDIGLDGDNSDATVFIIRKSSGGNELKIRGIKGGSEGRKIRIINDSGKKIKFEEDHNSANSGNKIYIFTSEIEMSTYGSCEFIYSTAISDDGGHWNLVQLDKT